MTIDAEPQRWSDDESDALMRRLMRAGQADGPSARALRAAPVAVAALLLASAPASAALAPAGGAAAATVAKSAVSPLVLLKWIAVGALAGSSAMALVHAPELARSAASPPKAPTPTRARAAAAPLVSTVPQTAPEPAPEPASSSLPAGRSSRPADVAREVALLDAARSALVKGHVTRALQLLDTLEQLPERALVPEATVLRVRALLAQGRANEAQQLVERFCASAPNSPQAVVLRSLLANSVIQPPAPRL